MALRRIAPLMLVLAAAGGLTLGAVLPKGDAGVIDPSADGSIQPSVSPDPDTSPTPDDSDEPTPEPHEGGPLANFTPEVLKSGEEPPQFVMVGFDGACGDAVYQDMMETARKTGAKFTFFLSELCALPESEAKQYKGPGHDAGRSDIGFGSVELIEQRLKNWAEAWNENHEIGTHFGGHFCGANGVGSWSTAQWVDEIEQMNDFIDNWAVYNKDNPELSPEFLETFTLPFTSADMHSARTPCLEGQHDQMWPAWEQFGYIADGSSPGGQLEWPRKWAEKGAGSTVWNFPLQSIQIAGYERSQLSMDYNFLYAQNECTETKCEKTGYRQ